MYIYNCRLWLADDLLRKQDILSAEPYKTSIEVDGLNYYNTSSEKSKNYKKIEACQVISLDTGGNEIHIRLISKEKLGTPNLALKIFSSYLANGPLAEFVRSKSLFRGSAVEVPQENPELTNSEIIAKLVEIAISGTEREKEIFNIIRENLNSNNN